MIRKLAASVAVAAALTLSAPTAALADDNYTPQTPTTPSLSGSGTVEECSGGSPAIDYTVIVNDPSGSLTTHAASLTLSNASNSMQIALGDVTNGTLSGAIPWPTAAWTRGPITAELAVDTASVVVPLSYRDCTNAALAVDPSTGLAETGMSGAVLPIGIAGGAVVLFGAAVLFVRRLRRH